MTTSPPPKPRRTRGRTALLILLALTPSLLVAAVFGDIIFHWLEMHSVNEKDVAAARARNMDFTKRVFITTPHGILLRHFLDEDIVDPISGRKTHIRSNALGYRGPEIRPKEPGEFRVLALGDSITLAAYCEEDETYPAQLEKMLSRYKPKVSVINTGVAGLSTREELLILSQSGLLTQPDVVLVGMYLNDAQASRRYPIPEGLAKYSAIARRITEMQYEDQVIGEAKREYVRISGKPFPTETFPEDAWRTNPAALEVEIAKAAPDWGGAWFPWAWGEMKRDLEVMQELAAHYHFELVTVLFPSTLQVEAEYLDDRPQKLFEKTMSELRVRHLDMLPVLRKAYRAAGHPLAYDHCHLTPEGNRISAEAMVSLVLPERSSD